MDTVEIFKNFITYISTHLKSEYIAFFSVIVTIIIYILNRQSELRFKTSKVNALNI